MKLSRTSTVAVSAVAATAITASVAVAAWQVIGTGSGSVGVADLATPGKPAATVTNLSVALSWAKSTTPTGADASYKVERAAFGGSSWTQVCVASHTPPAVTSTGTSCTDVTSTAADYQYRITSVFQQWTTVGAISDKVTTTSSAVPAASQPTSLSITNANGVYVHSGIVTAVASSVVIPSSVTGDVVRVTATDGTAAHDVVTTRTLSTTSASPQTVVMPTMNLTGLNEGTLTLRAVVQRTGANDSQARTSSDYAKDTVAPQLVTLEMFDGTSAATANGKIDRLVATFNETLVTLTGASTHGLVLTNAPSGGIRGNSNYSGNDATFIITEGTGAADTAVGSFSVALNAGTLNPYDAAGNRATFAATAPVDRAGPVPVSHVDTNGTTDGRFQDGDSLTVAFSEPIAATWGTSLATTVVLTDDSPRDTVAMASFLAGTVSLGSNAYIGASAATFAATLSKPTTSSVRVTLGACTGTTTGCPSAANSNGGGPANFIYSPDASLLDAAGNAPTGTRTLTNVKLF